MAMARLGWGPGIVLGAFAVLAAAAGSADAEYALDLVPTSTVVAPNVSYEIGETLAMVGDVNGDGFDDVLLGSPDEPIGGVVVLVLGRAEGWPGLADAEEVGTRFHGEVSADDAGRGLAGVGDLDGDGLDDFLIGAPEHEIDGQRRGKAYLIYGRSEGWEQDTNLALADATFLGEGFTDDTGDAVAGGGDLDGDGFLDFAIGAPFDDDAASNAGEVYLFLGGLAEWEPDTSVADAVGSLRGDAEQDRAGHSLVFAGDVNGDGLCDLLVGAPSQDTASNAGRVFLVPGRAEGWAADASLAGASTASFVGEAADDEAGVSLAGGGDVNGDGLDDLLIGAMRNGEGGPDAGQVYLIFGSPDAWSPGTDLSQADASFVGEAYSRAGSSLSIAGDVDGDGLDDLWIGASSWDDYDGNEGGAAHLVLGREVGWASDTDLSVANATLRGQEHDHLGFAVAGGGDVDGDGLADLWAGAPGYDGNYDGAGAAHLILGSGCVDGDGDGVDICHGDCDDTAPDVYWGAPDDPCDDRDTDCDGVIDETGDVDGDGYSVCGGDCNDLDATVFPGSPEVCDEQDTDCDGELSGDEIDDDGDGFIECGGPWELPADCDDADATAHPGASEVCGDGVDSDCLGDVALEADDDGDGYPECTDENGESDCDDGDPTVHPGAVDTCGDAQDSACDGELFEEIDQDGDGYPPCADDCDDFDGSVHPGASELPDGKDNDCDGEVDEDCEQGDDDDSANGPPDERSGCRCTQQGQAGAAASFPCLGIAALLIVACLGVRRRRP